MKMSTLRGAAAFAVLALIAPKISAITFTGTVTGVAEWSLFGFPNLGFDEGSIWSFDYSYESPSSDGHFWYEYGQGGSSGTYEDGFGSMKIFNNQGAPLPDDVPFPFPDFGYFGSSIQVVGGKVVGFDLYYGGPGPLFDVQIDNWSYDDILGGSVSITDPRATGVPDNGSTLGMLVAVLGTAGLLARNHRRKAVAMPANAA